MKKYMKKIIVGLLSFAFLFIGQSSLAATNSVQWNGDPDSDCRSVSVANYTTGVGFQDPCWPLSAVSAGAGETINVRIYYHNTGNSTATNTRVSLSGPSGSSTSKTFSATISSDQSGSVSLGSVTANIPSGQSLSFGSARWYPNQSQTASSASGDVMSGGLNIGSIASGWPSQGSVVISFKVSNNVEQTACSIESFTASNYSVTAGQPTILSWNTTGCAQANIQTSVGEVSPVNSGSKIVYPTETTIYTLVATGSDWTSKSKSLTVTVPVVVTSCTIDSFEASNYSITSGQSTTLSWGTTGCASANLKASTDYGTTVNVDGSKSYTPATTTTYTLTATSSDWVDKKQTLTVTVNPIIITASCVIDSFEASNYSITAGQSTTLSWGTTGCISANLKASTDYGTTVNVDGSKSYTPATTTTYTLIATASDWVTEKKQTLTVTVSPFVNACVINNFTVNNSYSTSITAGQSATLRWGLTSGCTSATITSDKGDSYPALTSTSRSISPRQTTVYTLRATGSNGLGQTERVTVAVDQLAMTGSITAAYPSCVIANGSSTCNIPFTWSTQNPPQGSVSAVTRSPASGFTTRSGNSGTNVSLAVPYNSATFYLYNNAVPLDDVTVTASCASGTSWSGSRCAPVVDNICHDQNASNYGGQLPCTYPQQLCKDPSASNYNGALPCTYPPQLCKDPTASNYNGQLPCTYPPQLCKDPLALNYNGQLPCTYIGPLCKDPSASNYNGALPCSYPPQLCRDVTATNYLGSLPCVYPTTNYCNIDSFTATDTSIIEGESSTLRWNTTDCTRVSISEIGNTTVDGVETVYPFQDTIYTLTAYGSSGAARTRYLTIRVDEDPGNSFCSINSFKASDTSIEEGDSTTLKWDTTGCTKVKITDLGTVSLDGSDNVEPTDDITYTLTAYASNGETETRYVRIYVSQNNNNDSCSIDNFSASRTYIKKGESSSLKWETTDCDDVSISSIGNVSVDGSRTVYPTVSTTYTLKAYGDNGGSQSRSIQINVDYDQPIYNSSVVTTVATNISQTGAQINGLVTNSTYGTTNTYFEYGSTIGLGSRTSSRSTNSNASFSDNLSGLRANTIYYFRAVAEGSNGPAYGAIEVFRTTGTNVVYRNTNTVREVVVQGPTVYGSASPIMLEINNRYQNIGVGDIIDYTVFYKNISNSTLTNPMVQVFIPQGITLTNYSRGTYSVDNKTLSVPIEDLYPGAEGYIYLQARVDSIEANLAQIVTTAILVYTNPNGAQENAMAYVLNNPKIMNINNNSLGGAALFGFFNGLSLICWLFLIIIILLLILLARRYYSGRDTVTTTRSTTTHQ